MGLLRIFCSADDEKLFKGHLSIEPDPIEELKSGDRLTIEFVLMQRNTSNFYEEPWSRALSASYSLRIGLFDAARSQLAFQNTFTNQDEFTKSGTLALDTVAAEAAVDTEFEAACSLEIEITDGNGNDRTVYRESVTLKKWLINSGSASQAPGEVYLTFAQWKALSMPRDGAGTETPMKFFTMQSTPSGFPMLVEINDDGTLKITPQ